MQAKHIQSFQQFMQVPNVRTSTPWFFQLDWARPRELESLSSLETKERCG
jgi:hypothetical protein